MNRIFISGSISIKVVNNQIVARLENMIEKGHEILIGDADGIDKAIQSFFANRYYKQIAIYCSGGMCRNNVGKWNVQNVPVPPNAKGRKFYMVKDEQMAKDADYGFLIWDGKSAGTINNLTNLIQLGKTGLVYFVPSNCFYTIKDKQSFDELLSKCNPADIDKNDNKISFRIIFEKQEVPLQEQLRFDLPVVDLSIENSAITDQYDVLVKETGTPYGYLNEKRSIFDFLSENLIKDLNKMIKGGMDYYAFNLLCSGLELLGSFFDQEELSKSNASKKRIDNALDHLFPKEYKANNIKSAITQQIRNGLVHQFRPTGKIALTSETSSNCPRKYHLQKSFDKSDKRIIFVIDQFIDDFQSAINKLKEEKETNLKSTINASRFLPDFLFIQTLKIKDDVFTTSAGIPYKEIESKSL